MGSGVLQFSGHVGGCILNLRTTRRDTNDTSTPTLQPHPSHTVMTPESHPRSLWRDTQAYMEVAVNLVATRRVSFVGEDQEWV